MKTVYLVSEALRSENEMPPFSKYDWTDEIKKIKESNADIILILSEMELEAAHFMYDPLIAKLRPWLQSNNKKIEFILPGITGNQSDVVNYHHIPTFIYFTYQQYNQLRAKRDLFNRSNLRYNEGEHFNQLDKLYTCYNNNPKPERALLVDELAKNNLLNTGIVTFIHPEDVFINGSKYKWKYHNGRRLFDEIDFKLNSKEIYSAPHLPKSFFRGFLDIVCESEYKDNHFFLTEKTLKSLAVLKPFITFASRGHNKNFLVKKYGFKLYDEYFDYSWDDSPLEDRIQGIVNNILRLKSDVEQKKFTLQDLYRELLPKMFYNQYRVLEIYYDKTFIPEFIKDIENIDFVNNKRIAHESIFIGYIKWIMGKESIL